MQDRTVAKVDELTPRHKKVDVRVRVLSVGDRKTIDSKFGGSKDLAEAVVGDETGTVIMTLWEDQIDRIEPDSVVAVENGYVSLVRGHMRLNVGKYGSFQESEEEISEVNDSVNVSDREYESDRRGSRGGGGGRPRGAGRQNRNRRR